MTPLTFEVEGLDELIAAIRDYPKIALPHFQQAMRLAVESVKDRVDDYPPASAANSPGRTRTDKNGNIVPMGYYERGRGWWYPIRRRATLEKVAPRNNKAAGVIYTPKKKIAYGVIGYRLAMKKNKITGKRGPSSEDLQGKWATTVRTSETEITGVIGNNASYVAYVNGMSQAGIHARRGWTRIDKALSDSAEDINEAFAQALEDTLEEVAQGKTP